MLIRVFQIVLVALVALFTLVALTLLLSGLQSTLIANAGISNFTFVVSARAFRISIISVLLLFAAVFVWLKRRRH
jgi:hypothetical protein